MLNRLLATIVKRLLSSQAVTTVLWELIYDITLKAWLDMPWDTLSLERSKTITPAGAADETLSSPALGKEPRCQSLIKR